MPNNQVFVVAGDVDTRRVLAEVARQYAGTPRSRETYVPFEAEPEQLSPREAVREMEGATYDLALAWPTVKLSHPDMYALDVAAYILGEGESSRLVERLKYEKQLVLSVGTMSDTPSYVAGMFVATGVSRPETWRQANEEILREVYRLRDELVGPAELAKAKKQKAAELIFARQTAKQAAEGLGRDFLATADPLYEKTYVDGIQKVTAEQVPRRGAALFRGAAAQSGRHRAAGRRTEVGRKSGQSHRGRNSQPAAAQRPARAAETTRPASPGQHPGLRARRLVGR